MKALTFLLSLFALFTVAMSTTIPQVDDSTSASPISVLDANKYNCRDCSALLRKCHENCTSDQCWHDCKPLICKAVVDGKWCGPMCLWHC
ncbi:hypothetical protein HBH70_127240 [Parastagonospora nodorum]|nr:hypothetical protein HBH50_097420 [Parastagonospora nodorum]KAH4090892.1 hypothetical protein HBH48_101190 [Parastagonospora nodorum]KAH4132739.1 hypothetical protein HBH47_001580 [Parastagonospora nodorum]KAH5118920.1 hypothetical protein HBH71_085200 [Parastagonospora nodorum]KAH5136091.1 hypothetical protein HBH70_127240 [Parastagonospora nodorum]